MSWSYCDSDILGPSKWCQLFEYATGKMQSPVDIRTEFVEVVKEDSENKLKWQYFPQDFFSLHNVGMYWKTHAKNGICEISGGPLNGIYELKDIHAHWGPDDLIGSEHTVNGKHFAAELHMVHWNKTKYNSIEEAMKYPGGVCALSVFLKIGEKNSELEKIVEKIPDIIHKDDSTKLNVPINPKLLLPNNLSYWTYNGSYTSPPCPECVIWLIFNEPVEISHNQLDAFRSLRHHSAEACNEVSCGDQILRCYRPTQPLGNRKMKHVRI